MSHAAGSTDAIFAKHRAVWARKRALRLYYEREIFDRIIGALAPGPVLEIGSGPGFFADYRPDIVGLDVVSAHPRVKQGDVHAMPLDAGSFANVVAVDVLHHLAQPARALAEVARVLSPGGRFVLVEPWTGPVGRWFYRHLHHEDCSPVADPWTAAFPPGKDAMDGNAMVPWTLLEARVDELARHAPLRLARCEPFGVAAYAATGGFQDIGLPWPIIDGLRRFEALLPAGLRRFAGLRALFVLERI